MHVTLIAPGSQGDVRPFVALAERLRQAGHRVRLATHGCYQPLARAHDLTFLPLAGNPQAIMAHSGQPLLASGRNLIRHMRTLTRLTRRLAHQILCDMDAACQGTDGVLYSVLTFPAYHLARDNNVPGLATSLQPLGRTRAFPSLLAPRGLSLGGAYNWLTHWLVEQLFWQPLRPQFNRWRREVGRRPAPFWGPYGPLQRSDAPKLHAYSPLLLPRPDDWPESMQLTGYWHLNHNHTWQPPSALVDFLTSGERPIGIGFGSMRSPRVRHSIEVAVRAVLESGRRAVLLTGWSGFPANGLPDSIFPLAAAPHDWLFPRLAAVVHHGGAGTTAAAARAGIPSIVRPFFFDQLFWGRRLAAVGAAVSPLRRRRLSAPAATAAIEAATGDDALRARGAALGRQLRAEDGVGRAVAMLEAYFAQDETRPVPPGAETPGLALAAGQADGKFTLEGRRQ